MNWKFFLAVFLLLLWCISGFLFIIFSFTDYASILRLEQINYHYTTTITYNITLDISLFKKLVTALNVIFVLSSFLLTYSLVCNNWVRHELRYIRIGMGIVFQDLLQVFTPLSKVKKVILLTTLGLFTLLRLYYLGQFSLTTDEVASFDLFVMEGPIAVLSFYPIPNNHILSNFLSLLTYQVLKEPVWVMRLPTFIISLAGMVIMYLVLIRYAGFAVATFSISIFCFSRMGIFYAIAGRGYFLLVVLAFVNFFSVLSIMFKPGKIKLYWFLFISTGVLGFFTIPSFLYAFACTSFICFIYLVKTKRIQDILHLTMSGVIVSLCSVFLYLPLLFISGIDSLVNNEYVQPMAPSPFWAGFRYYINYTEGVLIGHERLGKFVVGGVLLLSFFKIFYFKEPKTFFRVELPLLIMIIFPYLIIVLQKVYAPERALLYKSVYLYIISGFLFFWLLQKLKFPAKYNFGVAVLVLFIYSSFQVYHFQKEHTQSQKEEQQQLALFSWLKKNKPRNILVRDAYYTLFLNHYFKVDRVSCGIHSEKKRLTDYDLVILPFSRPIEKDKLGVVLGPEVYRNNYVQVFSLVK